MKMGGRKKEHRTITVDKELWTKFSITVLQDKGINRRLSDVIETLIKQYIEKQKKKKVIEYVYYQLAIPTDKIDIVFESAQKRSLFPIKLIKILALKIRPEEDISLFYDRIKNLKIHFFMFRNVDFKTILKNAKKIDLDIKRIRCKEIDDESLEEEIDMAIDEKNYKKCLDLIVDNQVLIKNIRILYMDCEISFYENGIMRLDKNLSSSKKIIDLMEKMFSFLDLLNVE